MNNHTSAQHRNIIAIVGNPNVGKSTLFNHISSSYSLVANAPYTTVSVHRSYVTVDGTVHEIIDTPGIISLDVQSEDGLITRDILLQERPGIIILCMDTNNIKRSLLLLAQVAELQIPLVICLNFVDEARQKGITLSKSRMETLFELPVVETVASEGRGVRELTKALQRAALPTKVRVQYKRFIEEALDAMAACFPSSDAPPDAVLMLLLMEDPWIEKTIAEQYGTDSLDALGRLAEQTRGSTTKSISRIIWEERDRWAETMAHDVMQKPAATPWRPGEVMALLTRHPLFGWLILGLIIYATYYLVGTVAAGMLVPLIETTVFKPFNGAIASMLPWEPAREFLIGDYGVLTTGLENAVGTVLPILTMFFLILNFLEDIGYIPNLAVLCNRLFSKVGLSGKAILPVVLGFGCKTMATLATKILDSNKERYIAIFLIAFAIPCSSQLGVNLAILSLFPFRAFCIVFGVLIAVELIAGLFLNSILKDERERNDFIMELPPIRHPNVRSFTIKTFYRLKWFLMEAIPLFVLGACLLFALDKLYILAMVKQFVFPVIVTFLDLPIETVDAFLLCIARHEAGAVILMDMVKTGRLDYIQTIVSVIIVTCFVPCFANIMAMIKELGLKRAVVMTLVIVVCSVIIGGTVNYVLRIV